jgi:hypothetical protein
MPPLIRFLVSGRRKEEEEKKLVVIIATLACPKG